MRRYLLLAAGAIVWVAADQLTKLWAVRALLVGPSLPDDADHIVSQPIQVLEGWFNLRLVGNGGAAWGLFKQLPDSVRVPFFLILTSVASVVIITLYRRTHPEQGILRWALMFILGGAVGNLIDRAWLGYVIDFIDWHYKNHHWPTFNVADIAITAGVGLLIIDILLSRGRAPTEQMPSADGT